MEQIQHNANIQQRPNIDLNQFNQHQDNIVKIQSLFRVGLAKKAAKRERLILLSKQSAAEDFKIAMFTLTLLAMANFTVFYHILRKTNIKNLQALPTTVISKI